MSSSQASLPTSLPERLHKGKNRMEYDMPKDYLGVPITEYQTRLILLHGAHGLPECPLVCEVFAADILHPKFNGLGVRAPAGDADYLARFDALSYGWGGPTPTYPIVCNGIDRTINENLYQALCALRHPDARSRHLWVDAICINQGDNVEKARHVFHMLEIYQKANLVIAWLGPADESLVKAIECLGVSSVASAEDLMSVYSGLCDLMMGPWFRRMWVQQEVFAARSLEFRCGDLVFPSEWLGHLSNIDRLFDQYIPRPESSSRTQLVQDDEHLDAMLRKDIIPHLKQLYRYHLGPFERFFLKKAESLDLIDTLLMTTSLAASNPRDYVYAILGMTKFPARACSIQLWMQDRAPGDVFIPVDYEADVRSILCAVTWAMLMKGGLRILAKFKFCPNENGPAHAEDEYRLPSWAIDWRMTGQHMRYREKGGGDNKNHVPIAINNSWEERHFEKAYVGAGEFHGSWENRYKSPPKAHDLFCTMNSRPNDPCDRLFIYGIQWPDFSIGERSVTIKWYLETATFRLDVGLHDSDIVVYFAGFGSSVSQFTSQAEYAGYHIYDGGGLWLLRPAEGDTYTLIACLLWHRPDATTLYHHWYDTTGRQEDELGGQDRRLTVYEPETSVKGKLRTLGDPWNPPRGWDYNFGDEDELRTFVIV